MIGRRATLVVSAIVTTAAVVSAVVCAGVGAAGAGSESGYCAEMTDAIGLYVGNPVTQMGYKVGRVDSVRPHGDHVTISFSLKHGRAFPSTVKAVTRSKSVLADRSLELVGNYRTGPRLTPGRCITLDNTATPQSISQITGSAADFVQAMTPATADNAVDGVINGLDQALRGNGDAANALMTHATAAMSSPDQAIADIGAIITNMAPLTSQALNRWSTIRQVVVELPTVVASATNGLWQGVINLVVGTGTVVATLYDIEGNYADIIWPAADMLGDAIHLASTRSDDIAQLLSVVPSLAGAIRQVSSDGRGLTLRFTPPTVRIRTPNGPQLCDTLNRMTPHSCSTVPGSVEVADVELLNLPFAKGTR